MNIKVVDMNCKNCVAKIEKVLLMNQIAATVTLEAKSVNLKKEQDLYKALEAIQKAGYTPEV